MLCASNVARADIATLRRWRTPSRTSTNARTSTSACTVLRALP